MSDDGATGVVSLVVRRELRERIRAKSFKVSSVILGLAALAGAVVPHVVGDRRTTTTYDVGLVADDGTVGRSLAGGGDLINAVIRTSALPDEATAERAVASGALDAAVVGTQRIIVRRTLPTSLNALIDAAVTEARAEKGLRTAGLSPTDAEAILHPPPLEIRSLQKPPPTSSTANKSLAFIGALFLYLTLLSFGLLVANGVVEEKSTRVSEVLLATMRPTQLLIGKVVGIGLVGVLQLVIVGVPAGLVALILGSFHLPRGTPLTFAAIAMWFVLGYAFYSCAFAAGGASASRAEEVGNVTMPLSFLLVGGYGLGVAAASSPDSPVIKVASFLPPFAPMAMLVRAATTQVEPWAVPLAIVLELATTWALVRLAGRVYTGAILRTGPRVRLRDAWRSSER